MNIPPASFQPSPQTAPPAERKLSVAYLTAGAAGMYCGSCMHDNTLAKALVRLGVDVQLIPTYTPIRTDENNVSIDRVFFGGINVYLQEKFPPLRLAPKFLDRFLDNPRLIGWAASRGIKTSARELGALTVSLLKGRMGHQRKEVDRLVEWMAGALRPELINFSNVLIAGCAPALKERTGAAVVVTLQGDDIFLDDLPSPYRSQALAEIRRLVDTIDAFVVHSRYYADFMSDYLDIPLSKLHVAPLGIDTEDFVHLKPREEGHPSSRPLTIGYLARLAKEKGLHQLVEAFIALKQRPAGRGVRLRIAGWLGEQNRQYADEQFARLREAGLGDAFDYVGEVDRPGKIAFLESIDLLSTPTTYREPKGLFVLESLAAGAPVVQPNHGAFPEILAATGGGRLFPAGDVVRLGQTLEELLVDHRLRKNLGEQGRSQVLSRFNALSTAQRVLEVYRSVLAQAPAA